MKGDIEMEKLFSKIRRTKSYRNILVYWSRMRGIRVEVGGIPSSMSQDLKESSNEYIDLRSAIEEI